MFGRISRSWELLSQSWAVLRQDKQLIIFPVLSSIACLVVLATFVVPMFVVQGLAEQLWNDAAQPNQADGWNVNAFITYGIMFIYYFLTYAVITFFNTALVSCAIIRFTGGQPTLADGFGCAARRLPQILGWALVAATVGVILRIIEDRVSWVGKLIVGLIGVAWSIAIYFVVPVLAVEKVGPFGALQRSAGILRKTWGESLTGEFSMSLVGFLLALPALAILACGVIAAIAVNAIWLAVLTAVVTVLYLIVLSVVMSTLQQIFLAGLYLYAGQGQVPAGFEEASLRHAFRAK